LKRRNIWPAKIALALFALYPAVGQAQQTGTAAAPAAQPAVKPDADAEQAAPTPSQLELQLDSASPLHLNPSAPNVEAATPIHPPPLYISPPIFSPLVSYPELVAFERSMAQSWPHIIRDLPLDSKTPPPSLTHLRVYEDGIEQPDATLDKDDAPVSICLMVDLSTTMKHSGKAVVRAIQQIIASLNPTDELEIVGFNTSVSLIQPYTNDPAKLIAALSQLRFNGGSALYDAISATLDQMKLHQPTNRPVIVIFSDGDDKYSHAMLPDILQKLSALDTPIFYSISPPSVSGRGRATLARMAGISGGIALDPPKVNQLPTTAIDLSHDIHTAYTLQYTSTHTQDGKLHQIEVRAQLSAGSSKPKAIFRQEYYAPQQ
jgi:VWFA-related protein